MTACEQAAKTAVEMLKEKKLKLVTAESCTGGLIAKMITEISGASEVFDGGVVSYANSVKENVLGVDGKTLESYGAVSEPVAVMMARGARKIMNADIAVSVTGIAGPNSDSTGKPVGLIYVALCDKEDAIVIEMRNEFKGEDVREKNREAAALKALELAAQYARLYPEKPQGMTGAEKILEKY